MKSEKLAIRKLTTLQSGVSSHYFIKKNGRGYFDGARFIYSLARWYFFMEKL